MQHHVGGHLKVAPEHTDPHVLDKMRKPSNDDFEKFTDVFNAESKKAGKKQYIVPYFIASHPGSDLDAMIDLAVFLKRNGYRPDQVQDFIPAPFDVATAMYYTGIDPFTKKPVHVAKATARPQTAAGADAVLQAGELLRSPRSAAASGPKRPDRQRLRLPDPIDPAARGPRSPPQRRQRALPRRVCPHHRRRQAEETHPQGIAPPTGQQLPPEAQADQSIGPAPQEKAAAPVDRRLSGEFQP